MHETAIWLSIIATIALHAAMLKARDIFSFLSSDEEFTLSCLIHLGKRP